MDDSQNEGPGFDLSLVNWFGLVAGVLMVILPFLGAWWRLVVGADVLKFGLSPFFYNVSIVGVELTSPLIGYVILAAKLTVLVGGVMMITGSIFSSKWWGRKLVSWGVMKVFWMLIALTAVLLIGALFLNEFLPSIIGTASELPFEFSLPYLIGEGQAALEIQEGAALINAPMSAELTFSFWIAVITAALGIGARIYNGKIKDKLGIEEEEAEEGVEEESEEEEKAEEEETEEVEEEAGESEEEPEEEVEEEPEEKPEEETPEEKEKPEKEEAGEEEKTGEESEEIEEESEEESEEEKESEIEGEK